MKRMFILPAVLLAAQANAQSQHTGLIPLTKQELKRLSKTHGIRRIKEVKLNPLGLKRLNQERREQGLEELPPSHARKPGQDTELDVDPDFDELVGATYDGTSEVPVGAAPAAVDNSTLPAFPPIGNQSVNNCAGWAMGYYQFSHNNGLALGWDNKNDATKRCSPKFIYNMINGGTNNGAYFSDALAMTQKHGCIPNARWPEDTNYRTWNTNATDWQNAISFRAQAAQYVYNVDTATGLDQMKQLLNNGYVLTFGTFINSWQYTTIKSNPTAASNPLAGKKVMHWMNGQNGGHAMTIVGYDDNAWVDVNGNSAVDSGELGVLKIANSWGTSWGNSGYMYLAYDALKSTSAVSGGPASGRIAAFMSKMAYHQPVKAAAGVAYKPRFLARVNVKHASRKQMSMSFGWSSTSSTSATSTNTPFAFINKGGAYAFDGSTTGASASFVIDVTDLPFTSSSNKVYFTFKDNASGYTGYVNSFELIDTSLAAGTVAAKAGITSPRAVDYTSYTSYVTYTPGAPVTTTPTEPTPTLPTADSTWPTVALTSPANGTYAYAGSTVTTTASASDNVGVTKVVFRVNDVVKCTDTTASYSCSFTMPYGTAKIQAYAYDAAGNVRYSSYVYVYRR